MVKKKKKRFKNKQQRFLVLNFWLLVYAQFLAVSHFSCTQVNYTNETLSKKPKNGGQLHEQLNVLKNKNK